MNPQSMSRRDFCRLAGSAALLSTLSTKPIPAAPADKPFKFNYVLASSLYGDMDIADILPEVQKTGTTFIDVWCQPHGFQREQIEAMGHDAFKTLLQKHNVKAGVYTCFNPGIMASERWMRTVKEFGGSTIVVGGGGPKDLQGGELKKAVQAFAEKIKPHVTAAEDLGVKIAVENHANGLIDSPESLLLLVEAVLSPNLGIAFAPYHLPQDPQLLARLIQNLGSRLLYFYAWEHGDGSTKKLPKVQELKQLAGYGSLDFRPLVAALVKIQYQGWTSIFMHPVPRGVPILPTAAEVTAAVNRSREYLGSCLPNRQILPTT